MIFLNRIIQQPKLMGGGKQQCTRGMRVMGGMIVERAEHSIGEGLADYPYLERDDISP